MLATASLCCSPRRSQTEIPEFTAMSSAASSMPAAPMSTGPPGGESPGAALGAAVVAPPQPAPAGYAACRESMSLIPKSRWLLADSIWASKL